VLEGKDIVYSLFLCCKGIWYTRVLWLLGCTLLCYNLITQVATLALRLEDGLRVGGKGMHNRLSIRRYSVSTGAYILIVV